MAPKTAPANTWDRSSRLLVQGEISSHQNCPLLLWTILASQVGDLASTIMASGSIIGTGIFISGEIVALDGIDPGPDRLRIGQTSKMRHERPGNQRIDGDPGRQ